MKNLKKILFVGVLALATIVTVQAQKFGHLNSQLLLTEMPEIKAADAQLENFQKGLLAKGEEMVKAFEANYNNYVTEANSGTLSAIQMQQKESALREEQSSIQQYEQEVQQQLAQKRQELYKPLFDKVKTAIQKIGKEQGYTMIFDTSVAGAIVHAQASEDVMALVKAELGL